MINELDDSAKMTGKGSDIIWNTRETSKYYKVEMILIYHLYPIIIGGTKVFGENLREMVRKNVRVLKGDR